MKKLITSLLAFAGLANAAPPQQGIQSLDPKSILFTTPTLSNDIAPLEPVTQNPSKADLIFHEDEWSQVEFFHKGRLAEIQRLLEEFKSFEQANRAKVGWRKVYVRKITREPVISGLGAIQQLEQLLGVKASTPPILFSSGELAGRVKNGFSFPLGGNVTLYGFSDDRGIPVLGANVGEHPDDLKLTKAFMKLNANKGLILVDWRTQLVLESVDKSGKIKVWRP